MNELKISVDGLVFASDLTTVTLHLKNSPTIEQRTAIMSPLVYLSDLGHSLPLDWSKDAWTCFGTHRTILRKVLLENIQDIKAKIVKKGVITEQNLRASIKQAMESTIKVKSKEKKSSITSKSETMIGKRKLKNQYNQPQSKILMMICSPIPISMMGINQTKNPQREKSQREMQW